MRLASRELRVRVPVETKSLSEKGGAVELNVVGMACGIRGSFYSWSSLTDRAEPAPQNGTSSNEEKGGGVEFDVVGVAGGIRGSFYNRSSLTDRAAPAP